MYIRGGEEVSPQEKRYLETNILFSYKPVVVIWNSSGGIYNGATHIKILC